MNDQSNLPLSEQFRIVAKKYVDQDAAARLYEETKTTVLAQKMKALGDIPAAHAERDVKASADWSEFIGKMVDARTEANRTKMQLEYIRMKHSEWMSADATKRAEMRL